MEFGMALVTSGVAFLIGGGIASGRGDPTVDYGGFLIAGAGLMVVGLDICTIPFWSRRIPDVPQPPPPPPPAPETPTVDSRLRANLETAVAASHEMISNQFNTGSSLDAQLVGLLVVLATAGGVFAVLKHSLQANRLILLVGIVIAAILCLLGAVLPQELDDGPPPPVFFQEKGHEAHHTYLFRMLGDLNLTIVSNDTAIFQRRGALNAVLTVLVLTPICWGLSRALAVPWAVLTTLVLVPIVRALTLLVRRVYRGR